jgi:hypothetical protein
MKEAGLITKLAGKALSGMLKETFTLEIFSMIRQTVSEYTLIKTEAGILATGSMMFKKATGKKCGQMEPSTKESIVMVKSMAMAYTPGVMAASSTETGKKTK